MPTVHLLDYVAGNIRSLVNAIETCGYEVEWIKNPEDVEYADVRPFPLFLFHFPSLLPSISRGALPHPSLYLTFSAPFKSLFFLALATSDTA